MRRAPAGDKRPFKDYYLILGLYPTADGALVDQAYWHRARLLNAQRDAKPSAKGELDELNEAYSVLGSPTLREEYDQLRDAVLGEEALPTPPLPESPPPPLPVMARQQAQPREGPRQQPPPPGGVRGLLGKKLAGLSQWSRRAVRLPTIGAQRLPPPHHASAGADALKSSTGAMRDRFRQQGAPALSPTVSPDLSRPDAPADALSTSRRPAL